MSLLTPDLPERVRSHRRLRVRGAGTKPALSGTAGDDETLLDLSVERGIVDYQPQEFTLTVRPGTPLREAQQLLAENRQLLPFDPPRAGAGATFGGTVAAGLSGSGRYRYGGVRDFLIGVRFIDGNGRLIRGGGQVVKNAAGFDLPKLMVGSLGRLGILTELTFKVFPLAAAQLTLRVAYDAVETALTDLVHLTARDLALEALDLVPHDGAFEGQPRATLWLRLGGDREALQDTARRLGELLQGKIAEISESDAEDVWREVGELMLGSGDKQHGIVKIPVTPSRIATLESILEPLDVCRRYIAGGQLAWVAWPDGRSLAELDELLTAHHLNGLVLDRATDKLRLGRDSSGTFLRRVKQALDPDGRFPDF